ncbi:hypothetical protein FO519_009282 [Halicephalobus sp. NKZ332]|nr:hypothetical protein FO519_009282 [Halicephalobus sp. NKZ332]
MKFLISIKAFLFFGILDKLSEGLSCETCSVNQIHLLTGNNYDVVTPRATVPATGTDKCLGMTVSCDVRGIPNAITSMMFQNGIGGPAYPADLINAGLVCTNGSWVFTQSGYSLEITEVKCILGGVNQKCGTCTPCDIVFSPKRGTGTVGSHWRDYIADPNGCLSLKAICPASPSGGQTYMMFNGNIGGPQGASSGEIAADLNCINGNWQYTQSGVSTVISEINCVSV